MSGMNGEGTMKGQPGLRDDARQSPTARLKNLTLRKQYIRGVIALA
jgi:hypothetical protein